MMHTLRLMVFAFALLADSSLAESPSHEHVTSYTERIKEGFEKAYSDLANLVKSEKENVKDQVNVEKSKSALHEDFKDAATGVKDAAKKLQKDVAHKFDSGKEPVKDASREASGTLKEYGGKIKDQAEAVSESAKDAASQVSDAAKTAKGKVSDHVATAAKKVSDAGKKAYGGITGREVEMSLVDMVPESRRTAEGSAGVMLLLCMMAGVAGVMIYARPPVFEQSRGKAIHRRPEQYYQVLAQ